MHFNTGRKQSAEHVAKRVAARKSVIDAWTDEQRDQWRRKIGDANSKVNWSPDKGAATAHRMAVSRQRTSGKPVIIYGLFDPRTGHLRYVGKTVASLKIRMSRHEVFARRGAQYRLYKWWRSLTAAGYAPEAEELETVPPLGDWVDAEQFWIRYFRYIGCDLVNHCDGGQGTVGHKFSPEHIERLRISHLGQKVSDEQRRKIGEKSKAAWARNPRRWSLEQREKTVATRAARRAAGLRNKKRPPATEETKRKISASKTGHKHTAETKAKWAAMRKGRKLSEAHRAAVSAGHRARVARLKEAQAST